MRTIPSLVLSRLSQTLAVLLLATATLLSAPAAAEKSPDEAKGFVQNLAQQAISSVAERGLSDSERSDRFRRLFVSSFDLPEIAQFVLGHYWRSATPEQQQEFTRQFEEMQVLTWSQRFKDYQGETLAVTGAAKDGDKGFAVSSELRSPSAQPTPMQWKVHEGEDGQLRVTDIVVEGVSMAITQRSDFNSMLQGNGGKVDALLTALRAKTDHMRTGG